MHIKICDLINIGNDFDLRYNRLQMCGSAGEGLPEILFLLEDEYAVDTNTVKSGHG